MIDLSGTRVAAVFAHPDDEAFTIGGALSAFTDRGATVTLISATRGEEGEIADPALATPENLGDVREGELRNAAAILGITDVRFLDFRDSGMFGTAPNENPAAFIQHPTDEIALMLIGLFKDVRPHLVLTFSEEGGYLHPDHVHIHDSIVAASERSSNLVPHLAFASFPREFFLRLANQNHGTFIGMPEERRQRMGQPLAAFTLIADVSPYVDRKIAAFDAHETQHPKNGDDPFLDSEEARREFTSREYYIQVPANADTPDPLALLAADLPGSEIREPATRRLVPVSL